MYNANHYPEDGGSNRRSMVRSTSPRGQSKTGPVSERVVHAVAAARDVDPLELEPLYDTVDPDALDRLFASSATPDPAVRGRIVFGMAGCEVTVYDDGRIDVDVRPEPTLDPAVADPGSASGEAETSVGE